MGVMGVDVGHDLVVMLSGYGEHRSAVLAVLEQHAREMAAEPFAFGQAKPEVPVVVAQAHGLVVDAGQFPVRLADQRGINERVLPEEMV